MHNAFSFQSQLAQVITQDLHDSRLASAQRENSWLICNYCHITFLLFCNLLYTLCFLLQRKSRARAILLKKRQSSRKQVKGGKNKHILICSKGCFEKGKHKSILQMLPAMRMGQKSRRRWGDPSIMICLGGVHFLVSKLLAPFGWAIVKKRWHHWRRTAPVTENIGRDREGCSLNSEPLRSKELQSTCPQQRRAPPLLHMHDAACLA